ncbi:MAG: zinc-binding dehydrogenase [Planctomycetes bacterium]|nr:zinc-binding dehydrogenase [Planctomycetota bacterium]MCB9916621.1 zinc-binding dehydrogenase [Planctomycetota bacterium]
MRALIVRATGSPVAGQVEFVHDAATPEPGPGEVLVRTEASALNHLDLWVGRGMPGITLAWPHVGGSDGAGVVEAVGEGVDAAWLGRRVLLDAAVPVPERPHPERMPAAPDLAMIGEHGPGTHRERFTAPVGNVLDVGDADPVAAAAFALAHLTAWRMLVTRAGVRAGDLVLVTGIGGGVALAALALAKHLGCRVIVTSRSEQKLARALELGADHAVLDSGTDWSREVRGLTHKRGVDVCVDSIGAATHLACLKSLARGGTLVTCGCTSGPAPTTDLARVFWNQQRIVGSTMGDMHEFRQVVALFLSGAVAPVIDRVYEASDGRAAYERLESQQQFGKIVLRWS